MKIKTKDTQREISETLGVTQPTVSNWLTMKSKPQGLSAKALEQHYPKLYVKIMEAWKSNEQ